MVIWLFSALLWRPWNLAAARALLANGWATRASTRCWVDDSRHQTAGSLGYNDLLQAVCGCQRSSLLDNSWTCKFMHANGGLASPDAHENGQLLPLMILARHLIIIRMTKPFNNGGCSKGWLSTWVQHQIPRASEHWWQIVQTFWRLTGSGRVIIIFLGRWKMPSIDNFHSKKRTFRKQSFSMWWNISPSVKAGTLRVGQLVEG